LGLSKLKNICYVSSVAADQTADKSFSILKKENTKLLTENSILKADIGYWQSCHKRAVEREETLARELQDKNARIKYLTQQLYEKKTERSKKKSESDKTKVISGKRKRGQQPGRPAPKPRDQSHLPAVEEVYDLAESEKYCSICGLPLVEMPDTEDSELIETQEVSGYTRKIRRKKYEINIS